MLFELSRKIINDLHISLCFTVLFTAFNAQTHIQKTITKSIQNDTPEYNADGYICIGIIYTFVAIGMCLSPSIAALIGWKMSMVIGSFSYLSYVTFDYFEISWLTYVGCAITGFGAAILWTCQATYIVLNSKIGSIYNSISLFWIFYQARYSLVTYLIFNGNSFVYYHFKDPHQQIDVSTRGKITIIMGSFVLCSVFMFCTLSRPIRQSQIDKIQITAISQIKEAINVFKIRTMVLSNFIFAFIGLNLTFFSVLAASLGFTKYLSENSKQYAPLSGVVQGIGEILGCFFALYLKEKTLFKLRTIPIACILTMVAYVICFIGLPDSSVHTYTDEKPLIELPIYYFLLANALLGFADACFHIDMYNNIGFLYPTNCAAAFATFKFVRCAAMAISFYYSNFLRLRLQTTILMTTSMLAFITYYCSWNRIIRSPNTDSANTRP